VKIFFWSHYELEAQWAEHDSSTVILLKETLYRTFHRCFIPNFN